MDKRLFFTSVINCSFNNKRTIPYTGKNIIADIARVKNTCNDVFFTQQEQRSPAITAITILYT